MKNQTLHVVLNSHLDPIWLWNLEQGIDAALATARTACDILDDYPEVHVTRGEAWFYETVAKHDPDTFGRMLAHVAASRLHPVGGWYVQPDCNLAAPETYRLHAEVSMAYFRDAVGATIRTGYNVDSFGHCAYLPDFYRDAGIENYIMMRPQPHEKELPGEVFRWRSPSGAEVLAARIPEAYCSDPGSIAGRMERAVESARRTGLAHALFFCGVGDHGGGPAREEIDYIIAHRHDFPGIEFRFSHPDAFFDAIRADAGAFARLPVVEGELQHHAIGCYTAFSPIKRAIRETESLFHRSARRLPARERAACARELLFATFHDLLAGTCIESAYPAILDRLGAVRARIGDAEIAAVRRRNAKLTRIGKQRIVIDNFGDEPFAGPVEFEPWLSDNKGWSPERRDALRVRDAGGRLVPHQFIPVECLAGREPRLLFNARIPARGRRIFTFDFDGAAAGDKLFPQRAQPRIDISAKRLPHPVAALSFDVLKDATDTWSHGPRGYGMPVDRSLGSCGPAETRFDGTLATETVARFADSCGDTAAVLCRAEAGLPGFRMDIRLFWTQPREIVKLALKPEFKVAKRIDSVSGGDIERALDGEEFPIHRAVRLLGADGEGMAVISDDIFACDVQPDGTLRLTLLRTPYFAHHDPAEAVPNTTAPATDLGAHRFELTILRNPSPAILARETARLGHPLRFSETTPAFL